MAAAQLNIPDAGQCLPRTDFSNKLNRLFTYCNFPEAFYHIYFTTLVNSGLYYVQQSDKVRCFCCNLDLHVSDLSHDGNVDCIHKQLSPNCLYIHERYKTSVRPRCSTAFSDFQLGRKRYRSLMESGITPDMALHLATEGFFYKGRGDQVQCCHCGSEVKITRENTIQMSRSHARKSKTCPFVRPTWVFDTSVENPDDTIHSSTHEDLLLEQEESKRRLLCRCCKEFEKSVTFIPCGHSVLCKFCQEKLRPSRCLHCQQSIHNILVFTLAGL